MGVLTEDLREFLDANRVGVLATLAPAGGPVNRWCTSRATASGC
jgi:hypothetical protein